MKVALVHELLTMRGGAERVLRVLSEMYPDAPIHTFLYDEKKLGDWFPASRVRPHPLLRGRPMDHHLSLTRFPAAANAWDFSEYDLVLSSSSAFAHGILTNGLPPHVCYVHAPARYLWDRTHDVLARAGTGPLGPLKRAYLERVFHRLRAWDAEASDRADLLLAPSEAVRRRIELYWRRDSRVVHPPLDDTWTASAPTTTDPASRAYWLVVSTLAEYKRVDVAVRACTERGEQLMVAGEGPALERLRALAGPTVTFVGHVDGEELRKLYTHARAVLFPGDEDFGLVPLEALACGTPVVALRAGGALESVRDGETGVFFDACEPAALSAAMDRISALRIDPKTCAASVERFSRAAFEAGIRAAVSEVTGSRVAA